MLKFIPESICQKCGAIAKHPVEYFSRQDDDVMVRTCIRCGYEWQEEPLQPKKTKTWWDIFW